MATTAVLPLKALEQAKGRLADELDAASRRRLVTWMFRLVARACCDSACIDEVLVVAGDEAAAAVAAREGLTVFIEPAAGLPDALAAADARTAKAEATLVVAADLPLARGEDLDRVCRAGGQSPAVVVVPTRDGGTGALLRRPAGVIATAYGPGSAAQHLALARRAGVSGRRLSVPNLEVDVDTPAALRALGLVDSHDRLRLEELSC